MLFSLSTSLETHVHLPSGAKQWMGGRFVFNPWNVVEHQYYIGVQNDSDRNVRKNNTERYEKMGVFYPLI